MHGENVRFDRYFAVKKIRTRYSLKYLTAISITSKPFSSLRRWCVSSCISSRRLNAVGWLLVCSQGLHVGRQVCQASHCAVCRRNNNMAFAVRRTSDDIFATGHQGSPLRGLLRCFGVLCRCPTVGRIGRHLAAGFRAESVERYSFERRRRRSLFPVYARPPSGDVVCGSRCRVNIDSHRSADSRLQHQASSGKHRWFSGRHGG
jgi:hypothetical protein